MNIPIIWKFEPVISNSVVIKIVGTASSKYRSFDIKDYLLTKLLDVVKLSKKFQGEILDDQNASFEVQNTDTSTITTLLSFPTIEDLLSFEAEFVINSKGIVKND